MVTVGYIGTFTGYVPGVTATEQLVHGIRGAMAAANRRGGVHAEDVRLVTGDDEGDPATGVREARRLVEDEGAVVLVFVAASIVMEAVLEYAAEAGVAIAGTGGALLPLFRPVHPWLFTARTPYESHAAAMVAHLLEGGAERLVVVSTEDGTGRSYAAGARSKLAASGRAPAAEILVHRHDNDLDRVVGRIASAEPDAILCTHFAPTSAALYLAGAGAGLSSAQWAFGPSATNPETVEIIGADEIEGSLGQSSFEALSSGSEAVATFLDEIGDVDPSLAVTSLTQLGYVSARAVLDALDAVEDHDGPAVRDALENLAADYGMFPPFALSEREHLLNRGVQIVRYQQGQAVAAGPMVEVDPDSLEVGTATRAARP